MIYYPPYHSKYNSIECDWAGLDWTGLERPWKGCLLDSLVAVIQRPENFSWRGYHPIAMSVVDDYEKNITLPKKEKAILERRSES